MPFGYTILGKGTTDGRWPAVRQEEDVYRILHSVQGSAVPVCLGTIDLDWTYFYRGLWITHFLMLSWGGNHFNLSSGGMSTGEQKKISNAWA